MSRLLEGRVVKGDMLEIFFHFGSSYVEVCGINVASRDDKIFKIFPVGFVDNFDASDII